MDNSSLLYIPVLNNFLFFKEFFIRESFFKGFEFNDLILWPLIGVLLIAKFSFELFFLNEKEILFFEHLGELTNGILLFY